MILSHSALSAPMAATMMFLPAFTFADWGIPLYPGNHAGPAMCLPILGIELDSLHLQVLLLRDHVAILLEGHTFLRQMINLLYSFQNESPNSA